MSVQQEEFLILLSLDSLNDVILFGFEKDIAEQVKVIARLHCDRFINDYSKNYDKRVKNNFSYKDFILDLKKVKNSHLIQRIESYNFNIYYRWSVFKEKISENYFAHWSEISKIAIDLQNLSNNLICKPSDDIITLLFNLENDWWSGNIQEDGIFALSSSDSIWDSNLEKILEIDFHLEMIARRIFSHPCDLSFLYRWIKVLGVEKYQVIKSYIFQELNKRLGTNKSDVYFTSNVLLFFC